MNRYCFIFIVFLFFGFACTPVLAHPPGEIQVSYDYSNGTLEVALSHNVVDVTNHYVREITIEMGDMRSVFDYSSQPDLNEFTYFYPVSIKKGDLIIVSAECNKYGKISSTLTAEADGIAGSDIDVSSDAAMSVAKESSPSTAAASAGLGPAGLIVVLSGVGLFYRYLMK